MSIHYSTAGQALASYRERTATMTTSSQRFFCAECKLSRNVVGCKSIGKDARGRVMRVCEICQKAGMK